jgi:hypothetical protein
MAPKAKSVPKGDILQQKSPAEFFAENKNIAGFDNASPSPPPPLPPRLPSS